MNAIGPQNHDTFSSVQEIARAGYGIFHDMPFFHPEENSPIVEEGLPFRARNIALGQANLSTSHFTEGVPAIDTFNGAVHLLAASGTVTDVSTCDNGTRVTQSGSRFSSSRPNAPQKEEILKKLQADGGGYSELTVDAFAPACVLVNLDRILSKEMERLDIINDSQDPHDQQKRLARIQAVINGDTGLTDRFGHQPLAQEKNWADITRKMVSSFEDAQEYAKLTNDTTLPVYAIANGRLHAFAGYAKGHDECTNISKQNTKGGSDYSARKISWLRALENNAPLLNTIAGHGKPLLTERLSPLMHIVPTPTPLTEVIAKAPCLSIEEKAALACSVMPCFKPEYKYIPINAFLALAPTEEARRAAVAAAEKLPKLRDAKSILDPDANYVHGRGYHVESDSFHNITVYGNQPIDWANAMADTNRLNDPIHTLMTQKNDVNERIVPTDIFAFGEGRETGTTIKEAGQTAEAGFAKSYRDAPSSQKLFDMSQERIKKYGPAGVIYVDPIKASLAASDPDAAASLQETINTAHASIQKRYPPKSSPRRRSMGRQNFEFAEKNIGEPLSPLRPTGGAQGTHSRLER